VIIPFPTEWKVIKFHGSKPPTSSSMVFFFLINPYTPFDGIIDGSEYFAYHWR